MHSKDCHCKRAEAFATHFGVSVHCPERASIRQGTQALASQAVLRAREYERERLFALAAGMPSEGNGE